jgi:hypothetical protein
MKLTIVIATFALVITASVIPVAAHHSIPQTFDISKEITIQGVVTKIEWTNPHTRVWVEARNDDGTVSNWELELAPPNALKRNRGLDFIKPGDQVTVVLWRAKDGSMLANALDIVFPDGRVYKSNRSTTPDWEMKPRSR